MIYQKANKDQDNINILLKNLKRKMKDGFRNFKI